jgi:hypothetical protein
MRISMSSISFKRISDPDPAGPDQDRSKYRQAYAETPD